MYKILVVDPETDFIAWAAHLLQTEDVSVQGATDATAALHIWEAERPDVVLTEVRIAPFTGIELLKRLRQSDPNALVILFTGFPGTNAVIECMRMGAYDFLRKEALAYDLRAVVECALNTCDERRSAAGKEPAHSFDLLQETIIGSSPVMQEVLKMVGRVARSDAPVTITGESGSGKEIVARAVHKFSPRSKKEFVAINCAAIPENLLESELFGHEKGAFTGASVARVGRFEQCDGGTLFLDEIGDMPTTLQSKILRVLQEGEFCRVGSNYNVKTDVRVLAATNKDLEAEVSHGKFREDLFYRLNVVRIHLPPLRARREDVRRLADFFLQRHTSNKQARKMRLSEEAMKALESHDWPGNVRELENTILRACALSTTDVLMPRDLPIGLVTPNANGAASLSKVESNSTRQGVADPDSLNHVADALFKLATSKPGFELIPWMERELALRAMSQTNNDDIKAAKMLGITRGTLKKRLETR